MDQTKRKVILVQGTHTDTPPSQARYPEAMGDADRRKRRLKHPQTKQRHFNNEKWTTTKAHAQTHTETANQPARHSQRKGLKTRDTAANLVNEGCADRAEVTDVHGCGAAAQVVYSLAPEPLIHQQRPCAGKRAGSGEGRERDGR